MTRTNQPGTSARNGVLCVIVLVVACGFSYFGLCAWRAQRAAADRPAQGPLPVGERARVEGVAAREHSAPAEPTFPPQATRRKLHARDRDEWQGMRVNLDRQALCDRKAGCGLAMACIDGRCGPCERSSDCADAEVCVLDHCVRAELSDCERRSDCGEGELCVLSGYSGGGARNNESMESRCLAAVGGVAQRPGEHTGAFGPPDEARVPRQPSAKVDLAALRDEVEARIVSEQGSATNERAE